MRELTVEELGAIVHADAHAVVNRWLARGDGAAVYQNMAIDHSGCGDRKTVSYGSAAAQLEQETPPERLPDIGGQINWPFCLEGTYRGPPIPPEVTAERRAVEAAEAGAAAKEQASKLARKRIVRKYSVVVGNVGAVLTDATRSKAVSTYDAYVRLSKEGYGRVGGEPVSLYQGDELVRHYAPFEAAGDVTV